MRPRNFLHQAKLRLLVHFNKNVNSKQQFSLYFNLLGNIIIKVDLVFCGGPPESVEDEVGLHNLLSINIIILLLLLLLN